MPSPALAGFGWTPPLTIESGAPPVMAAPTAAVDSTGLGSFPGAEPSSAIMTPPAIDAMPLQAMPVQNAPIQNMPVQAAPLPAPSSAYAAFPAPGFSAGGFESGAHEDYAVVEGFGASMPLATVLGQILPEGYVYSFDPAVNPGVSVSWQGGRPWNRVLTDALAPRNLTASIAGKTVYITSGAAGGAGSVEAAAAPMPLSSDSGAFPPPDLLPPPSGAAPVDPGAMADYYRSRGMDESGYHPSYPRRNALLRKAEAEPAGTGPGPVPDFATPSYSPASSGTGGIAWNADGGPGLPEPEAPQDGMMTPMPLSPSAGPVPLVPAADSASFAPPQQAQAVSPASAPAAALGPVVLDPYEIRYWQAAAGENLQSVLSRWSAGSGVRLVWSSETNFTLPVPVRMQGTFADAVTQALAALETAGFRPAGKLYPNLPAGPSVLIVKDNEQAFTN